MAVNAALWGLATALGWGGADFIARFAGRAIGPRLTLFGMLTVGSLLLLGFALVTDLPFSWSAAGLWVLLLTGVGIMVATLLLYWALARGPVTLVSPIVGAYPALNVLLALAFGVRPSALEWTAMAGVMVGVAVVAGAAGSFGRSGAYEGAHLRFTIAVSGASAVSFAVAIAAAQAAIPIYGEMQTVLCARWISLASIALLLFARREAIRLPLRWWPFLLLQGILDATAYIALLYGSGGEDAMIAVVVSSCFGAVTVLLARLVLREAMTWPQWGGIALVVGGVATLSAL